MSLVTVQRYREPDAAHVALSLLTSHQIPGFVTHEHNDTLNWMYSDALGGVKLQVPPEYYEQARELLDTDHGLTGFFPWLSRLRAKPRTFHCWSCGHPYLSGDPRCEECGTSQPDPVSYGRYVVAGTHYDGACGFCNTPYKRQDYTGGVGSPRCAYCQRPLLFG
jgi:hypothetical protein